MRRLATWLLCLAVGGQAADAVRSALIRYPVYRPETVEESRAIQLDNRHNRYVVKLVEQKPAGMTPGNFTIRLREPSTYFSFSRPLIGFLDIRLGELSVQRLCPDFAALECWQEANAAGARLPLNFGGTRLMLEFRLQDDSPLLWIDVRRLDPDPRPVRLQVSMIISAMTGGKWTGYDRRARTAARHLEANPKPYPLTAADRYLVLYDEKLQPGQSDQDNCMGPCLLAWQPADFDEASLALQDSYRNSATFRLAPQADSASIAIWTGSKPRTLAEFESYFQNFFP